MIYAKLIAVVALWFLGFCAVLWVNGKTYRPDWQTWSI